MIDNDYVDAIKKLAQDALAPHVVEASTPDGQKVTILVHGRDVTNVEQLVDRDRPKRIESTITFAQLVSLVEYSRRFQTESSVAFVGRTIVSVILDYHAPGAPGRCDHVAEHGLLLTEEFEQWVKSSDRTFQAQEFAEFLADHILEVADPDEVDPDLLAKVSRLGETIAPAARVLDVSRSLQVTVKQEVESATKSNSGEIVLKFACEHQTKSGGAPVAVPSLFLIRLRPYRGMPVEVQALVRLKYRLNDGKVTWSFKLLAVKSALEVAQEKIASALGTELKMPVYFGSK